MPDGGAPGPQDRSRLGPLYAGTAAGGLTVLVVLVRLLVVDAPPGPASIALLISALLLVILGLRGIRRERQRS